MKKIALFAALIAYSTANAHTTVIIEKRHPSVVIAEPVFVAPPVVYVEQPAPIYTMVETAPPSDLVEEIGVAPGPSYVWIKGNWQWDGRWVWAKGHWADRPHPSAVWVQGGWTNKHNHYVWVGGRWE